MQRSIASKALTGALIRVTVTVAGGTDSLMLTHPSAIENVLSLQRERDRAFEFNPKFN